jgi:hypothetical protein
VVAANNWQSIIGGLAATSNAANLCSGYSHPDSAWATLTTSTGNNADFIEVHFLIFQRKNDGRNEWENKE